MDLKAEEKKQIKHFKKMKKKSRKYHTGKITVMVLIEENAELNLHVFGLKHGRLTR